VAERLLLRGGSVVSMDPKVGDIPKGDVLIEGDKIAQVAPDIHAAAQVIDVTGDVVIPGFVDSHRHTWECAIRGCAPNATLDDYFVEVLDTFPPIYRAEDVYASNLAGALECINAGITTLLDWSHINNTPEHADAGVRGLQESGIRGVYAYGSANLSLNDYWNQSKIAIPKDDVRRVRDTYFSSKDGLLTMQLATRGPGFCMDEVCTHEWTLARELGLPITVHVGMGRLAGRFAMIKQLKRMNLLGSDTTYIHCCYFDDEEWQLVKDTGGKISIASQIEMQMGHGQPPIGKSLRHGLRPSLSIDVVSTAPGGRRCGARITSRPRPPRRRCSRSDERRFSSEHQPPPGAPRRRSERRCPAGICRQEPGLPALGGGRGGHSGRAYRVRSLHARCRRLDRQACPLVRRGRLPHRRRSRIDHQRRNLPATGRRLRRHSCRRASLLARSSGRRPLGPDDGAATARPLRRRHLLPR